MPWNLDLDPAWEASYHFMDAIRKLQPHVLEELRDAGLPQNYYKKDGSVITMSRSIPPAVEAWAVKHGIVSKVILRRATAMLIDWRGNRRLRQALQIAPPQPVKLL